MEQRAISKRNEAFSWHVREDADTVTFSLGSTNFGIVFRSRKVGAEAFSIKTIRPWSFLLILKIVKKLWSAFKRPANRNRILKKAAILRPIVNKKRSKGHPLMQNKEWASKI